ncbi:hypothetical protein ACQ9BL_21910 [Bacillus sp. R-CC1]
MKKVFYEEVVIGNLQEIIMKLKLPRRQFFQLGKTTIRYDWDTEGSIFLECYVEEVNRELAKKELISLINLLSYLYGFDIMGSNNLYLIEIEKPSEMPIGLEEVSNRNLKNIITFYNELNKLEEGVKKRIHRSIAYYARALRLRDLSLYEEAFLVVYKSTEIISEYIFSQHYKESFNNGMENVVKNLLKEHFAEEYQKKGRDLEISNAIRRELKYLVTARRKVMNCVTFLGLDKLKGNVGEIVQFRNQIGAHASSSNREISMDLLMSAFHLSLFVISRMVKKNDDIIARIKGDQSF